MAPSANILLTARGLRAFADGFISLLLPVYLTQLGFDALQIGILTTATLIGSAAVTLTVGLVAHRREPRGLLTLAALPGTHLDLEAIGADAEAAVAALCQLVAGGFAEAGPEHAGP